MNSNVEQHLAQLFVSKCNFDGRAPCPFQVRKLGLFDAACVSHFFRYSESQSVLNVNNTFSEGDGKSTSEDFGQ